MNVGDFERLFLIRLAPIYLACRWRVMGHGLVGKGWPRPMLENDLMGMHDYDWEMQHMTRERLKELKCKSS